VERFDPEHRSIMRGVLPGAVCAGRIRKAPALGQG
jgi:hypothetical protein